MSFFTFFNSGGGTLTPSSVPVRVPVTFPTSNPTRGIFNVPLNPIVWGGSGDGNPNNTTQQVILPQGVTVKGTYTTLDKLLASALSGLALFKGAGYVPTNVQPQQYSSYPLGGEYPAGYQYPATNAGGRIQQFIEQNTGFLLLAGGAVVLLLMKPPVARNGIKRRNGIRARAGKR